MFINSESNFEFGLIILAAGQSKRFGGNKLLANIKNKAVVELAADPFRKYRQIRYKIVVTGAYDKELRENLVLEEFIWIKNEDYLFGGMSSSIRVGIKYFDKIHSPSAVFIQLGDVIAVKPQDVELLINAFESENQILVPTFNGEPGHPLLISSSYFDDLTELSDSSMGLRGFLKDHQHQIEYIPSDNEGILRDIDYPSDLPNV